MSRRGTLFLTATLVTWGAQAEVALADNCGDPSDCFSSQRAAILALIAIATVAAFVVGGPGAAIATFFLASDVATVATGRDPLTWEKTPRWVGALGIIDPTPGNLGGRLTREVGEKAVREVGEKAVREVGERTAREAAAAAAAKRAATSGDDAVRAVAGADDAGRALRKLDQRDLTAIADYTGSGYREINRALRYGSKAERAIVQDRVDDLSRALKKLPIHEGPVYRGTSLSDKQLARYVPGGRVTEPSFTSSSANASDAFAGNTEFLIDSRTGRDVSSFSQVPEEAEVLFDADTQFDVLDRTFNQATGKWEIYLREVV